MNRILRSSAPLALAATLLLGACTEAPSGEHVVNEPVRLEEIPGTEFERVILTQQAVERTGIETTVVKKKGKHLIVPHSAILFDPEGKVWVYTNPEPRTYVRHEVELVTETGEAAILSEGPSPGTRIVTIGVPELYGAEYEIGH
ncbi:MAG TPA: hypothetical protein VHI54_10610 [Actinomycetota bacterium]|nr:hypothetical protein [Actinomycetota bacterium]